MVSIKGILKHPYVKLSIGDHKVRTRVVKSNLNPRWDEELTLATPYPPKPLNLVVYDKDTFSADDKMGEAEIDLTSLIAAVNLNESQDCEDGVTVRTIPATKENGFAKESLIKLKNGQLVQKVHVRLQNVERGEIKLELMWQPYTQ
ncbi:hypothetical protein GOP47_0030237 [Adiantum capillus-veneris]|nr:hypothetical protein GOP47_0030237 [Adiantum capillus-veneris]